jgi:HKD family nuclease
MSKFTSRPELLWNKTADHCHSADIQTRLKDAKHFTCMIAFAKRSGFAIFDEYLRTRLDEGMSATFVIGIDFYQSEPIVIQKLVELKARGAVEVYIGNFERKTTFHPKLYLFEESSGASAIVGSANMTGGGLVTNHELSVAFHGDSEDLCRQVENWIDRLIEDQEIVEATNEIVKEYARRHEIYSLNMGKAQRRAERAAVSPRGGLDTLAKILLEMKADSSDEGFDSSLERRAFNRIEGLKILKALASKRSMTRQEFLYEYERLIKTMHSGGLQRGKTTVARSREPFGEGVRSLLKLKDPNPSVLLDQLRTSFESVIGAGPNVITEILHLLDDKRYAVMNKNSVSGLRLAGISTFPKRPTKQNVDGATYSRFCADATRIRKDLGLGSFSELDALFNYAYWRD